MGSRLVRHIVVLRHSSTYYVARLAISYAQHVSTFRRHVLLLHLGSSQFFLVLILCPDKIIVISGCQNNTVVIKKKIAMYASAVRCSCTSFVDCRAAYSSALVFLRVSFIALCVELSYYNASMSPWRPVRAGLPTGTRLGSSTCNRLS